LPVLRHGVGAHRAASAIATEQGFAFEPAYGTLVRGWALAQQGRLEEGIAGMREAQIDSKRRGGRANAKAASNAQHLRRCDHSFDDHRFYCTCSLAFGAQRLEGLPICVARLRRSYHHSPKQRQKFVTRISFAIAALKSIRCPSKSRETHEAAAVSLMLSGESGGFETVWRSEGDSNCQYRFLNSQTKI
jgi:hypothetical protein